MAGQVSNPTFQYDGNGNLVNGAGLVVNWTSFNMVSAISRYGAQDRFHYGADQERLGATSWCPEPESNRYAVASFGF
jgi:hypothetical protein